MGTIYVTAPTDVETRTAPDTVPALPAVTFDDAVYSAATDNVAGMQQYIDAFEARATSDAMATFRMGDLLPVAMVHSARVTAQLNLLIREYDFHVERMAILRAIYGIRCRQAAAKMTAWPWMRDAQICYPPFDRVATAYIAEFWQQFDCKDTELKSW